MSLRLFLPVPARHCLAPLHPMKNKSTPHRAPAGRSPDEGGFVNLRVLVGLFLVLAGGLFALIAFGWFSNVAAQPNTGHHGEGQMTVVPAQHSDLSPSLRHQPMVWPLQRQERERHFNRGLPIRHHDRPDPVIQSSFSQHLMGTRTIPAPSSQWAGVGEADCGEPCEGAPPDTNGAVGKTQYLQMVNNGLQVFDKITGTSLLGPITIESVWEGFGGACEFRGSGDPIVVYDRLADRWVISQFAKPEDSINEQSECIAVSQTGDATSAWYRYDFRLTTISERTQDYPKLGVWPDGYYMCAIMFRKVIFPERSADALGMKPFVFDRAKMLVGDPTATLQTTQELMGLDFFLPSDLDGIIPPPAGAPNFFVGVSIEAEDEEEAPPGGAHGNAQPPRAVPTPAPKYKVWAFHVDWNSPANSTFSLRTNVPAANFAVLCPEKDEDGDCLPLVPQLGVRTQLDAIADRLMFRNAYRRFSDGRESMLNNFTVSANSVAGIRWFELQRMHPSGWTLRQQSTYQPDSTWRWMGSIASDNQGNIALGFSASSETIHPQIRYAGRSATDAPGILSGEQHLFDGTGSQWEENRWGDYSDMTVDPVDDCTFYYTNEYYAKTGHYDGETGKGAKWKTRIGYFKFAQCTPPDMATAHFTVAGRGAPFSNTLVSIDGIPYGATLGDGTFDAVLLPGFHTYAASNPAFGTRTGSFSVTNGEAATVKPDF